METAILLAPLAGAAASGFGHRLIGDRAAQWLSTALLFAACALSWAVFLGHDGQTHRIELFDWLRSGDLVAGWAIRLDRLTATMLIVITTVSALVHFYSLGYMADDGHFERDESYRPRFFAYLSLFTFAMLMLVTSDNLAQMFFGWEGVGLASYLLIGFYHRKDSANAAAIKAFVVNRVGDFGFALGIFALFAVVGGIGFDEVFAAAPQLAQTELRFLWTDWNAANLIAVLLFVGAMGKSAQFLLHTWLPDAMEGPTPVSALIHAATMVTAGVFLVCRMSPLFEFAPEAKTLVVYVGAVTAFFAATVGLVQNDIKRVIAYSTCSQLGYMFVAAGVGVYSAAMFHLLTHAFFKALLFLGAGSVIHGMHHEQDMRNYGGLRSKMPWTFWSMLIGTLAITGVGIPLTTWGFAGFLSKDAIIESAWAGTHAGFGFWTLVIAALLTSFYSWRLMFLTFFGEPRGEPSVHAHAHESPATMLAPLAALAVGAVVAGVVWHGAFFGDHDRVNRFFGIPSHHAEAGAAHGGHGEDAKAHENGHGDGGRGDGEHAADGHAEGAAHGDAAAPAGAIYMAPDNHVMDEAHHAPKWVKASPFAAMLAGLLLAMWFYLWNPSLPQRLAENQRTLYGFLLNKWRFDEIYDFVLVNPARRLARGLWTIGDGKMIDGFLNGVAMGAVPFLSRLAGRAQSGYIFTYALAMVLGAVALVTWMSLGGGAG